jgi:hypothetical protein
MIPTYVVIPFLGKIEMTNDLVKQILDGNKSGNVAEILLLDNGDGSDLYPWAENRNVYTVLATGWNIHRMFNFGINRAVHHVAQDTFLVNTSVNVALMNNDLILKSDNYLDHLADRLRADPTLAMVGGTPHEYPTGTSDVLWTNNELGHRGESVMLRGELPFRFDERYEWWRGDDDLVAQMQNAGYWVGLVPGAVHDHIGGGGNTASGMVDFTKKISRDTRRFYRKWPQIPTDSLSLPLETLMPIGTEACDNP